MHRPSKRGEDVIQQSNGIITQMRIIVTDKLICGTWRILPVCPLAHEFATLLQCRTIPDWALEPIKALGYEVTYQFKRPEPVEETDHDTGTDQDTAES